MIKEFGGAGGKTQKLLHIYHTPATRTFNLRLTLWMFENGLCSGGVARQVWQTVGTSLTSQG